MQRRISVNIVGDLPEWPIAARTAPMPTEEETAAWYAADCPPAPGVLDRRTSDGRTVREAIDKIGRGCMDHDHDTYAETMNASLERTARRQEIALRMADAMYASDDVELTAWASTDPAADMAPRIESVDGGYWISARVWVDFESVETEL